MPEIADNIVDVSEELLRWADGRQGLDAVAVRIGLNGAQLLLVDGSGEWERWVFPSVDAAVDAASALGIPVHTGGYPEDVRLRMNRHRRSPAGFGRAAYPEQGRVGPVIPYPESRPRRATPGTDAPRPPRSPEDGPP